MPAQRIATWCAVICSVLVYGCGSADQGPTLTPQVATPLATPTYALHEGGDSMVGAFHVSLDPSTLRTSVTPIRGTQSQPPQGQRYDLDIANFLTASSFEITDVTVLGSGNYRVTFRHAHPFPAPIVANPPTGTNRADLGYTGRLVILVQGNTQRFFGGSVLASCGVVVGPDGYVEAGQTLPGFHPSLATAFPYKLLVDEAKDNREGVSDGGDPQGSYAAAFGGWQRASLGAAGTGWTGFDYLHGGQSIINTFVLDKEAVANEQFDFDVALVIQYTDPRGAGGKVDRLPPTVIDVQQFAYRLPYAALDCSQIVVTASPVPLKPQNGDTEPYTVKVRDWDAGATEAADSKVGDESDVSLVQLGAAGHPMLELDAPGVLNSIVTLPDAASGTGISDAPLTYNATLTNQTNAPAGEYWGLLQVTDPEDGDAARGTYHTGIDPDTILPDSTRTIGARTYQVVPITVGPAVPSVIAVTPSGVVGAMGHSITFSAQVSGTVTTYAWNFGSDATPPTSTVAAPLIALPDEPGSYNGTLTLTNAGGTGPAFPFSYEVGFPTPPHWAEHQITTHIWGFHQQPNAVPAAVINGVPAAVFQPNDELDNLTDVAYVRALTANPQSVADWSITMVGRIGHDPTLAEIAGRPVIAMADDVTGDLSYGTTPQANPTGPADWNFHVMAGGGSTPSITEHEGRPAVAYRVGATVLWYARASSAVPTSTGDWNKHSVLLTSQAGPQIAVMQSEAGPRLVIGATFNMKGVIAGAKPLEPLSSSDWVTNYFDNDDPNSYAIALTTLPNPDGTDALVVAWEDANNSGITRRGTWFAPTPGMIIFDAPMFLGQCAQQLRLGLTTSHGRPFMVIPKPNELGVQMFRGLSSHPLAFDWQSQDPFSIQTDTIDNIVPLDLGDHLGVFYLDLGSGAGAELHYAAADSPW